MTISRGPLVSVLTPVYNGERHLIDAIESVLSQTYEDWEYVIVNNCSTDRSLSVAQRYAERDPRIRVVTNERFVNVITNHNITFRLLSPESKYCKVVHADDWLFPDCLRRMVELAEANPTVGIVGAYRLDDTRVGCDGLPYPSTLVPGRDLCRSILLGGPGVFGSATSILIRSDFVRRRDPFLDEGDFHSDTSVCYEILKDSDFGFVHQVLTFTRRHPGAQTSMAEALNTYQAGQLRRLIAYGPFFLSVHEYEGRRAQLLDAYYRFLGRALFEPSARQVWSYHSQALQVLGHPISWTRMIRALLPYWHYAFVHPLQTLRLGLNLSLALVGLPPHRPSSSLREPSPLQASGSPLPPSPSRDPS